MSFEQLARIYPEEPWPKPPSAAAVRRVEKRFDLMLEAKDARGEDPERIRARSGEAEVNGAPVSQSMVEDPSLPRSARWRKRSRQRKSCNNGMPPRLMTAAEQMFTSWLEP